MLSQTYLSLHVVYQLFLYFNPTWIFST